MVPKVGGSGKNLLGDATPANGALADSALKRQVTAAPDSIAGGSGIAKSAPVAPLDQIMFLCPNGHKLNAPRALQGHAGQCPHCKATFRIPVIEHLGGEGEFGGSEEYAAFEQASGRGPANGQTAEGIDVLNADWSDVPRAEVPAARTSVHTLARLVRRLWSEREHGGIVELHLTGGAMLVPEWFDAKLSQDTHGLFAIQAADGTVTMTIVPWDSIQRVVVRGVVGLPDGLFE
jgi:hypothetical protein